MEVVPAANENVDGPGGNGFPFHIGNFQIPSMRYQQLYSRSEFASRGIVDSIKFRRDVGTPPFTTSIDVKISLSYAATTLAGASNVFANNIGTGRVTVFDGMLTLSSATAA